MGLVFFVACSPQNLVPGRSLRHHGGMMLPLILKLKTHGAVQEQNVPIDPSPFRGRVGWGCINKCSDGYKEIFSLFKKAQHFLRLHPHLYPPPEGGGGLRHILFLVTGFVFVACLCLAPHMARADETLRQVLRLVDQNQWTAAKSMAARGSTDVKTLYEWLNLQRDDTVQDFDRYAEFVREHPDWPGIRRIRANAERVMGDDVPARDIAAFYKDGPPVSGRGAVAYARALKQLGRGPEAQGVLNDWFIDAGLSNDEQANVLSALYNIFTRETLMRRLDRLIGMDQTTQARALARRMGQGVPELLEARIALSNKKPGASAAVDRVPQALRNDPGLVYERLKWRRRAFDTSASLFELFRALPNGFVPVNENKFWTEHQILMYRLIDERKYQDAYMAAVKPIYTDRLATAQAEWFAGHIAYTYLKQPGRAFRHFETLYGQGQSPLTRARASFWAARASDQLKYPDVAAAWYRVAAGFRGNFYGQLAARKLPGGATIDVQGPPGATAHDRAAYQKSDLRRMAHILRDSGDTVRAGQFLERIAGIHDGHGGMIRMVVDDALDMKLTSTAIKISRESARDGIDFADHVFPILDNMATHGVEPAFVYAIIRQESAFDVDAVSASGARGLMQLMPRTAKDVARSEKTSHRTEWLTDKPSHNIRLGSAYLRQLNDRLGSYALVAAAYNAGPGRLRQWMDQFGDPRDPSVDLVEWVERIPVYETRNYVQRVLESTAIYREKLGTAGRQGLDSLQFGK
jgi:soluble lytic murein transglycosylase